MAVKKTKKTPKQKEVTGLQTVSYVYGDRVLNRSYTLTGTYTQLRAARKDPTVQLARALLVSCIQAGSWNIEADEDVSDDVKGFFNHLLNLRESFLYNTIAFGKVDYGWQGFEKIFVVKDGRIEIESLKPLLHDMTSILVTKQGHFLGYRQTSVVDSEVIDIFAEKCLHCAFDVEAGNLYGMPLLENIRQSCDDWDECNDGARRYDKKLAGTHWVVYYPTGTATVDGETVDNSVIAANVLDAMMSSGSVAVPTTVADYVQELNSREIASAYSWRVELLSDEGKKQESFGARLKYLDNQKVRGLLMPERSLLEGQFGTKAESETHGGLMLTNVEAIDRETVRMVNDQLVNQLLILNFGEQYVGKVRLVAAPLVDKQIDFIREIYKSLNDPDIDLEALRDKLNIPTKEGDSEGAKKTNPAEVEDSDEKN